MPPARSSFRGGARRIGIAAALLLLLGLTGEILLRINRNAIPIMEQIKDQATLSRMVYKPDPDLGALLASSRRDVVGTPDFTYTLQTDHAGSRTSSPGQPVSTSRCWGTRC
jgi:hypothetical protein